MKSFLDSLHDAERDRLSYGDVIEVARTHFEENGFDFNQSIDVTTDNPALLFNISGGVKYEHVLSGDEPAPQPPSVASVQRCIRADGLDKVGYSGRHHIAFDMLGHFNFFEHDEENAKRAAIVPAYELLQVLGVESIFAKCHPQDDISRNILAELGVLTLVDENNTHTCNQQRRSGNRVELGRFVDGVPTEIWNIVFTLYEGVDNSRVKLDKVAFDSGASLDRLVAAANGKLSDYDTENWKRELLPLWGVRCLPVWRIGR